MHKQDVHASESDDFEYQFWPENLLCKIWLV